MSSVPGLGQLKYDGSFSFVADVESMMPLTSATLTAVWADSNIICRASKVTVFPSSRLSYIIANTNVTSISTCRRASVRVRITLTTWILEWAATNMVLISQVDRFTSTSQTPSRGIGSAM